MKTAVLLFASNIFMTIAWYGHLQYKHISLWKVILISWLIAFVEYCLMVPANRIGHEQFNVWELKTMQEVISLIVFIGFATFFLKEGFKWNYLLGFGLIASAVFVIFYDWK